MIGSTRRVAVHAYGAPCDMRKSFDTLAVIAVQQMRQELLSGDVFLFVGKDRKRAKALFWDGTGLCVYAKRLEQGRFAAPWQRGGTTVRMTMSELALFLEGSELIGKQPLSPAPYVPAPLLPATR